MYILPMLTHLEVVALGDRSDISPDQHLNYASIGQRPYSAYLSVPTLPGNLYTCTVVSIARLEVCTAKNTKICEFSEVLGKTLHVPVC